MEEYVDRKEFELLKEEVKEIKVEMKSNADLLNSIDKKIDSINSKIQSNEKITNLTIEPLEARINKIESNNTWLWRTIAGAIITLIVKIIFDASH